MIHIIQTAIASIRKNIAFSILPCARLINATIISNTVAKPANMFAKFVIYLFLSYIEERGAYAPLVVAQATAQVAFSLPLAGVLMRFASLRTRAAFWLEKPNSFWMSAQVTVPTWATYSWTLAMSFWWAIWALVGLSDFTVLWTDLRARSTRKSKSSRVRVSNAMASMRAFRVILLVIVLSPFLFFYLQEDFFLSSLHLYYIMNFLIFQIVGLYEARGNWTPVFFRPRFL